VSERSVTMTVNGQPIRAEAGTSVAVALIDAQHYAFRVTRDGNARGPLCGMGICYECRVTIDDVAHQRACMIQVRDGMRVRTAEQRP
jgi:D-hydroxyproline dehydrogenase subunit gamma